MRYQAVTTNTKLYFGPNIPSLFLRDDRERGDSQYLDAAEKTATKTSG